MKNMTFVFKGFLIGLAELIPGISAGSMALMTGTYPLIMRLLSQVNISFLIKFKQDYRHTIRSYQIDSFVLLCIGMLLALLFASSFMLWLFDSYQGYLYAFIIGLLLWTSIDLLKNYFIASFASCLTIVIGVFFAYILFKLFNSITISLTDDLFLVVFIGFFLALFFLLPGISASSLLVILGFYDNYLAALSTRDFHELYGLGVGVFFGLCCWPRCISFFLEVYRNLTMLFMVGLILSTIFQLNPIQLSLVEQSASNLIMVISLIILGVLMAFLLTYQRHLWQE